MYIMQFSFEVRENLLFFYERIFEGRERMMK